MNCYSVSFLEEVENSKGDIKVKRRTIKFRSKRKPLELFGQIPRFVADNCHPDGIVLSIPTVRQIPDPAQLPEV